MQCSTQRIPTTHTGSLPQPVIAGLDCGLGTFAGRLQVDSRIAWMKLAALRVRRASPR